jgi:AcrR family transcriptional regulator
MGRRSSHKPDELRELIIKAATELLEQEGLGGMSAREVAKRIGYSAGTLYNVFDDLDDLILTVECNLLDQLAARLRAVPIDPSPTEHLCQVAAAYLAFTQANPKLWNLLFEHHMPPNWQVPAAYKTRLEDLLHQLEGCLSAVLVDAPPERIHRAARVLWSSIHGITSLATADKLPLVTTDSASALIDDLVRTFVAGLSTAK